MGYGLFSAASTAAFTLLHILGLVDAMCHNFIVTPFTDRGNDVVPILGEVQRVSNGTVCTKTTVVGPKSRSSCSATECSITTGGFIDFKAFSPNLTTVLTTQELSGLVPTLPESQYLRQSDGVYVDGYLRAYAVGPLRGGSGAACIQQGQAGYVTWQPYGFCYNGTLLCDDIGVVPNGTVAYLCAAPPRWKSQCRGEDCGLDGINKIVYTSASAAEALSINPALSVQASGSDPSPKAAISCAAAAILLIGLKSLI